MSEPALRVVTWNVEWQPSGSAAAATIRERIEAEKPEIVCLTEAYRDFFGREGHVIEAEADYGYPLIEGRRKVLLWSKQPWHEVDHHGHPSLPSGRFVSATTDSSIGPLRVIGVCIPWRAAHVRSGRRDRALWEDHLTYLSGLQEILDQHDKRTIVVGDYNQRVPARYVPEHVHQALLDCVGSRYRIATAGPIAPLDALAIDHVSHSLNLEAVEVGSLSNIGPDGTRLSDHFGVSVTLR